MKSIPVQITITKSEKIKLSCLIKLMITDIQQDKIPKQGIKIKTSVYYTS